MFISTRSFVVSPASKQSHSQLSTSMATDNYVIDNRRVGPPPNKRRVANSPQTEIQFEQSYEEHTDSGRAGDGATPTTPKSTPADRGTVIEQDTDAGGPSLSGMQDQFRLLQREMADMRVSHEALKADFQNTMTKAVIEVVADLKHKWIDEVLEKVNNDVNSIENVMDHLDDVKSDIRHLQRSDTGMATEERVDEEVKKRMGMVEDKVVDLEARSRRNNIIIHGVQEQRDEQCMWMAYDIIQNEFRVSDDIVIERAHRIGKKKAWSTRARPLIIRFLDYNHKMKVKSARRNLPSNMSVTDDLPFAIRNAQKQLIPRLNAAKQHTHDVFIRFPATLVVDGYDIQTVKPVTDPTKGQTTRHNSYNNNNNNNNNNHVAADTGERGHWVRDASQQLGRRNTQKADRSYRRENREPRENSNRNNYRNNIAVNIAEEDFEEGECRSEGSLHEGQVETDDYGDRHNLHRRVDHSDQQGASHNNTGRRGATSQRGRGFPPPSWNSERQGFFYRKN